MGDGEDPLLKFGKEVSAVVMESDHVCTLKDRFKLRSYSLAKFKFGILA